MKTKYYTDIYCKIHGDRFPDTPWLNKSSTTNSELFKFLNSQLEFCTDDIWEDMGKLIWYLCICDEHGFTNIYKDDELVYENTWHEDESNSFRIRNFLDKCLELNILNQKNHDLLIKECIFCDNTFEDMWDIGKYMRLKDKSIWVKSNEGKREKSKKWAEQVHQNWLNKGYVKI